MDFSNLKFLHLHQVFAGTGIESIECSTNTEEEFYEALFEETLRNVVWVTDDAVLRYCVFVTETSSCDTNKLLKVVKSKSSQLPLYLWRIDGKMFPKYSKCDCALFQKDKFLFVEFKANAVSKNTNSQETTCEKACEQLQVTFKQFCELYDASGRSFRDMFPNIKALIVLNRTIPRGTAYQKNLQSLFLRNNKILLNFDSVKKF